MLCEVSGCGAWALEDSWSCASLETLLWSVIYSQCHHLFRQMEIGGGVHLDHGYHFRSTCSKILYVWAMTWEGTEMSSWLTYLCSRTRRWTFQEMTSDAIFRDGILKCKYVHSKYTHVLQSSLI